MKATPFLAFALLLLVSAMGQINVDQVDGGQEGDSPGIQTRLCHSKVGADCCTRVGCNSCCAGLDCYDTNLGGYHGKCAKRKNKCEGLLSIGSPCKKNKECCNGNCHQIVCGQGSSMCFKEGSKCDQPPKDCKGIGGPCKVAADCCQPKGEDIACLDTCQKL